MNNTNDDIKRYLKLISVIPAKFIDELFEMYGEETIQTDLVIDLDMVASWLNCKKKELLRTLRNTYKEGIDFICAKGTPKVKYGNNTLKCLITPDCFKRLCMLSRSKNAEQVRTYFIEIESLIIKYRTQLIEGIKLDILKTKKLNKIRDAIEDDNEGYTYIIKASKDIPDIFKIGHSKNLVNRLRTYQTGKLEDVEVVFIYKTINHKAVERCVKGLVQRYGLKHGKEIYQLNLDVLKYIMKGCGTLSTKLQYKMKGAPKMTGEYYAVIPKKR